MGITLLTGQTGSGKSRYLIDAVNAARAEGRPVQTFLADDAIVRSPDPNVWCHGMIGCRIPGVMCQLDHLVSLEECGEILSRLDPGTLAAFDEARFFDPNVAQIWIEASRRGLDLLISTPSTEQRRLLDGHGEEKRLSVTCGRCGSAEATSTVVQSGHTKATALCSACDAQLTRAAHAEIIERLERQAPYPGEKAIYQPIELDECTSWTLLRQDSAARAILMREVLDEVTTRTGARLGGYLDVGCNTGYFCHAMSHLGLASHGVDLVEADIEVARLLSAFIRRDSCQYTVGDVYDYLNDTKDDSVDVTSAFSVVQWLILQRSLDHGLECLSWLFEKTGRICFLEMGYASEEIYRDKLPKVIDRDWVRNLMARHGGFDEIRCYPAGDHGLMRDLFVGLKAVAQGPGGSPAITTFDHPSMLDAPDELARQIGPLLLPLLGMDVDGNYFRLWESEGVHVTPVDFYQPIPDTRSLGPEVWEQRSDLVGIELNVDEQLKLLRDIFPQFANEYNAIPLEATPEPERFYLGNQMFDGTDALVYYCMIRHFRPSLVIEIGSGFSTCLALEAARCNGDTSVAAVDPYPSDRPAGLVLEARRVEELDFTFFDQLGLNDILFIDSSHVSRIGGDVNYLFLEVLPRLSPGVFVHVHDIFLPAEYRKDWVLEHGRYWSEQYLLQAFLSFNSDFEVILSNHYLGMAHLDVLQATFPRTPWWGGGSFWMRRKPKGVVMALDEALPLSQLDEAAAPHA